MENNHLLGCIEVFVAVVDNGSFSAGARQLNLSQPSVSRQVNSLEEHLGVRLLQRTTRRVSLTEAGQIYYEKAVAIQRDVIEAGLSVAGFKDIPSGLLKIAAPHTWADKIIAPHIGEFLARYPDITLDLECNDQFQDVIAERLDLVIRVGTLLDSSYIAVPLAPIQLIVCATPNYLALHGTPVNPVDIQNHPCILFEDYDLWLFSQGAQIQQIRVSGPVRSNTVTAMISAVRQHLGLTLMPDLLIRDLIRDGSLVNLLPGYSVALKNLPLDRVFALYPNRKHLAAKVRAFIDFIREKFT